MKKVLLIVSFLFLLLLNMQIKTEDENILSPAKTTFVCSKEKHPFQDELKNYDLSQSYHSVYCLTTRSQVLPTRCERPFKVTTRLISQSVKFSTLRIRSGHWVYVLRKIII